MVCKEGQTTEQTFHIVGSEEVDMSAGKISHKSPLGRCMLDKRKGDIIVCDTPNGEVRYTIINVK